MQTHPSSSVGSPLPWSPDAPLRRRVYACARCRRRKVRCDGDAPKCSNCRKAGADCVNGASSISVARNRLKYLEDRIKELEKEKLSRESEQNGTTHGPHELRGQPSFNAPQPSPQPTTSGQVQTMEPFSEGRNQVIPLDSTAADSPAAASVTSRITREQPLAHEVGLLSLANACDPKYLGPSSGVTFARLIYESAPQTQGLPSSVHIHDDAARRFALPEDVQPAALPSHSDCQQFADAYFSTFGPLYPFLLEDEFDELLDMVDRASSGATWDHHTPMLLAHAQVYLVLCLGARTLETKLENEFSSRGLFATAMGYASSVPLHDNIEGVKTLLLLVLHSFYNPGGLNAWFLMHTIIASCLDLGLQRHAGGSFPVQPREEYRAQYARSAIFWSAYSLDRTLTTILGRPLTLRDEAIDCHYPGMEDGNEVNNLAIKWYRNPHGGKAQDTAPNNRIYSDPSVYSAFIFSLRFDRIVAEIKLMIYRVARSTERFPWPDNVSAWQQETERACEMLWTQARNSLLARPAVASRAMAQRVVQQLELKYHQCIMLLYRPSPQVPRPHQRAIQQCFSSAMEIIRIYTNLNRFSHMDSSWLTAHSLFVSAITILYCLWIHPSVRKQLPMAHCLDRAYASCHLLASLGRIWPIAEDARQKLTRLITVTAEVCDASHSESRLDGVTTNAVDHMQFQANSRSTHAEAVDISFLTDPPYLIQPEIESYAHDGSITGVPYQDGADRFLDELGDLRDFFDLDWLK